jgi:nicotinate-nucleotide adenylyltransferase
MKVAIYGGSFDPVHFGHLWVAQHAGERLGLDEVIFVPAATSPLKPHGPVASDAQRLMMLKLAIGGSQPHDSGVRMTIDDCEIRRGGKSYTIDTVDQMRAARPDDQWFLLVGSDAFAAIRKWHRPEELLRSIIPVVFRRAGDPPIAWETLDGLVTPERAEIIRDHSLTLPMIEVSSADIRRRVAEGSSIRFLVPSPVAALIRGESLYQAPALPFSQP